MKLRQVRARINTSKNTVLDCAILAEESERAREINQVQKQSAYYTSSSSLGSYNENGAVSGKGVFKVSLCRTSEYSHWQKVPCRTLHLMRSRAFELGFFVGRALPRQTQHAELHIGWGQQLGPPLAFAPLSV